MRVFVKGMKMPMCCAECRFLIYADFGDFVECSALVAFMTKDKVPEGRREDCPLVDEETVKHGKWIEGLECLPITYICPFCGYTIYGDDTNFCPNCGADMREEN